MNTAANGTENTRESSPENLILIGFSGTGKTHVGQEVARLLTWEFIDMDAIIEANAGKPVRRIFEEDGEPAFRLLEKQALRDVCSGRGRVIAAGGGAVIDPDNRELMLNRGVVICLEARPDTIRVRLVDDETKPVEERPLLAGPDAQGRITALKEARRSYYVAAHETVQTDDLSIADTAQEVVNIVRRGPVTT